MKLVSFSVLNYRSITSAHKINLDQITVLVGKNNEGKSNILAALNVAMNLIIQHSKESNKRIHYPSPRYRTAYKWTRDFPVSLQDRKNGLESIFTLNFRLTHDEAKAFNDETGIKSNEDIPIKIKIGKENEPKIEVPKKGRGDYNKKSQYVTDFISKRISFNCIEAIRTEKTTINAIQSILNDELKTLEKNEDYIAALEKIKELQNMRLNSIADKITPSLQEFLPSIQSVKIDSDGDFDLRNNIIGYRNDINIRINDGTCTSIGMKGDGVKSLVALAILKDKYNVKDASIIAIEEPESHLHPSAMQQLVNVINSLSEKNQIIITTHNPLFVYRNNIKSNIVVEGGAAKPASSMKEIRDILGILPSDNLINALNVLVVEGDTDKKILSKLLPLNSDVIKKALSNNSFEIIALQGAANLTYELNSLKNHIYNYFVFLDNDLAGISAVEKAKNRGLLTNAESKLCICRDQRNSEIEDCINESIYMDKINEEFSIQLNSLKLKGNNIWSDRMKEAFRKSGIPWDDSTKNRVKTIVADCVTEKPHDALIPARRDSINSLIESLNILLSK